MDTLAIAERSFYRVLLSLRTAADVERGLEELLPPLLRATASRGVRVELALRGTTIVAELGVISPELRDVAALAATHDDRTIVFTSSPEDADADSYVRASIGGGGHVYLQRAAKRPLSYRHRENIELLVTEMAQLCEASPDDLRDLGIHESTRRFQARLVTAALQRTNWNVARAARELGVRRGFIYDVVRAKRRRTQ